MATVAGAEDQKRPIWAIFGVDLLSATCASALVSPWVTAIDIVVVRKAATGASLGATVRSFLSKPKMPPVGGIIIPFLVYFGTYSTANLCDSIYAASHDLDMTTISSTMPKFLATTAVSTGLCVYKDGYFAKLLGTSAVKAAVPRRSFALFTTRDAVTVFASFNMPSIIAPKLHQLPVNGPISSLVSSEEASLRTAQMIMPAAIQVVSTPIHLLGLDYNNRQEKLPFKERIGAIRQHVHVATPLRMMRIIPAFGIGSVANTSFRRSMLSTLP
ncbi:hypothetical protein CEP52_006552 [Fusarium oligoseptatum]|uniref:Sequence orphan n=1 Tax=Fusarium oligoseptatum TaxID=2604345 RepID=A0A428TS72_9HYPO|nr:hypothetical protein CEP52_006552 [Fusarium oligoseptatum]